MQDALLQARQLRITHFDAEIAARDHHRVAREHDLLEARNRLAALDLRDDARVAARGHEQRPGLLDVRCLAHERDREVVHVERGCQPHVLAILVRQRLRRQAAATPVDALVIGDLAAGRHLALDARTRHRHDPELDLPVAEDQFVAGLHVLREVRVRHADCAVGTVVRVERGIERERFAFGQDGTASGKAFDADLRALQVTEHGDVLADDRGNAPHAFDTTAMVCGLAMREIHADDVGAEADQFLEDARGVGRRTQCGDDLGTAKHGGKGMGDRG